MSVEVTTIGNVTSISLSGDFDFSHQDMLEQTFEQVINTKPSEIEINLLDTTFIDSSVIRMFLKLRDMARHNKSSLVIVNCSDRIREIFVIGGFDQIFTIN